MACFLKKHGLIQVRCNKDWGAVVKEKYRALAGAGPDTVADMRCPYEKNRDVIGRFVEAQKRVGAFMKDNQDEALQIVAEELDLDEEAVREMYDCYDFSMDVTDEDKKGFQKTADFMLESGMIEEELNVNSLFL